MFEQKSVSDGDKILGKKFFSHSGILSIMLPNYPNPNPNYSMTLYKFHDGSQSE